MQSTHTAELNLDLPLSAREADVFPALGPTSLLSIGKFCDVGCIGIFDKEKALILRDNKIILEGTRCPITKLWTAPLPPNKTTPIWTLPSQKPTAAVAYATTHSATPAERVAFIHASLFSPALSTLTKAQDNNYVTGFPGLTAAALKKHPPHSTAMFKGHMDQTRKNQRSTKHKVPKTKVPTNSSALAEAYLECKSFEQDDATLKDDFFPAREPPGLRTHNCYAVIMEATGQIYTDQTGRFIIPSSLGNNYILILYDYDSNYIMPIAFKNRTAPCIKEAYAKAHARLVKAGLRPLLQ
jgi:hypothetical protein